MLKEKMEQLGIRQALEELGYDYDEIFGGLSRELMEVYASYSWQKITCMKDGRITPGRNGSSRTTSPITTYFLQKSRTAATGRFSFQRTTRSIRQRYTAETGITMRMKTACPIWHRSKNGKKDKRQWNRRCRA